VIFRLFVKKESTDIWGRVLDNELK